MTRLVAALIRHADYLQLPNTPSAHQPFPLTIEGENQAKQAIELLAETTANNGWQLCPVVDSSNLLRAWQTAKIISQGLSDLLSLSLHVDGFDELAERSLGNANNLSIQQIETIIHNDPRFTELPADWKSNSHYRLPMQGAESLLEAGERVANHLVCRMAALAQTSETDIVKLFVGHGAAFRHAAYHLQVLEFEQIAQLSMHHARPVYLEYNPDGKWKHVDGEWKMRGERSEYTD